MSSLQHNEKNSLPEGFRSHVIAGLITPIVGIAFGQSIGSDAVEYVAIVIGLAGSIDSPGPGRNGDEE